MLGLTYIKSVRLVCWSLWSLVYFTGLDLPKLSFVG
jgi:hypothetical protein